VDRVYLDLLGFTSFVIHHLASNSIKLLFLAHGVNSDLEDLALSKVRATHGCLLEFSHRCAAVETLSIQWNDAYKMEKSIF
jgi:hypothetical protein